MDVVESFDGVSEVGEDDSAGLDVFDEVVEFRLLLFDAFQELR